MLLKETKRGTFLGVILYVSHAVAATHEVPWDLIKKYVPENPVVVEAGAQFGEDTKIMANLWPGGQIYAFEPMPENYKHLKETAQCFDNVIVSDYAIADCAKQASFWICGGASSLLRPTDNVNRDYFHADLDNPIQVNCISLDTWRIEHSMPAVDFLWFDMEGNELYALKGALETLKSVKAIFIEVNLRKFWHDCVQYKELKQWLSNQGFTEKWSKIIANWNGNVLFVRD